MASRKDYKAVAKNVDTVLAAYPEALNALSALARLMADDFKQDNPNFRYDTFFEACGLDSWGEVAA